MSDTPKGPPLAPMAPPRPMPSGLDIKPDPTLPGVTWELDIEDEQLEGDQWCKLASLIFSSAAGQCRVDNFTPDALRAIALELLDHADQMDGQDGYRREDVRRQLAKAIPYIGVPQYAVPDGFVDECERVAGIELPDAPDPRTPSPAA